MPSTRSSSRRAAVPIALIMRPCAPIRIAFWESLSTQISARTRVRPSRGCLRSPRRPPRRRGGSPGRSAGSPPRGSAPRTDCPRDWSDAAPGREQERPLRASRPARCSTSAAMPVPAPGRDREDLRAGIQLGRRAASTSASGPLASLSTLLTAIVTGTPASSERPRDEAVAGADALLAVEHQQRRVGALELLLDAFGHP